MEANLPEVTPGMTPKDQVTNAFFSISQIDYRVLEELRRAKDISMNSLAMMQRTTKFQRFVSSELMDRFLLSVGAYFIALFEAEADRRMQENGGDMSPGAGGARGGMMDTFMREDKAKQDFVVQVRMKQMSLAYAAILLKEGTNYRQIHNEEVFFEALIDMTYQVTRQRFDRKYWDIVECELGRMFRSPGFNKAYRVRERPIEHVSVRELWQQRLAQTQMYGGGGDGRATTEAGRETLYGLTSSATSPMMVSTFTRPGAAYARPFSAVTPGRGASRPSTVGTGTNSERAHSRNARTHSRGQSAGSRRRTAPGSARGRLTPRRSPFYSMRGIQPPDYHGRENVNIRPATRE